MLKNGKNVALLFMNAALQHKLLSLFKLLYKINITEWDRDACGRMKAKEEQT